MIGLLRSGSLDQAPYESTTRNELDGADESSCVDVTFHGTFGTTGDKIFRINGGSECEERLSVSVEALTESNELGGRWVVATESLQAGAQSESESESGGRVVWIGDTLVDSTVLQLEERARRNEESARVGGADRSATWRQQVLFGGYSQKEVNTRVLLELPDRAGQLVWIESDEVLREWTMDDRMTLKEIVAVSNEGLPVPSDDDENKGVPKKDADRIARHVKELKFSPLVCSSSYAWPSDQRPD